MLIQKLNQINNILNQLIKITDEDISNIKEAKHEEVFKHISLKEELSKEFNTLKSEIDYILSTRNRPIEEIFSKEEEIEFDKFRTLLNEFHNRHKFFAKLSFSVTNFYNTLLNKIKGKKQLTYEKTYVPNSYLKIKA